MEHESAVKGETGKEIEIELGEREDADVEASEEDVTNHAKMAIELLYSDSTNAVVGVSVSVAREKGSTVKAMAKCFLKRVKEVPACSKAYCLSPPAEAEASTHPSSSSSPIQSSQEVEASVLHSSSSHGHQEMRHQY